MNFYADYTMTIAGEPVSSARTFAAIDPATEEVVGQAPEAMREQLDEAVAAARKALPAWRALSVERRQELVSIIGDRLEQNAEHFMRLLTLEQGKPHEGAQWDMGGSIV